MSPASRVVLPRSFPHFLVAVALIATTAAPVNAQRQALSWPQVATPALASTSISFPPSGLLGSGARDHRYEGLYVGLGTGAAFSFWNAAKCSGRHDCLSPLGFGLLITGLAGLTGALVGGLIPK